jgi:hypothetical protein
MTRKGWARGGSNCQASPLAIAAIRRSSRSPAEHPFVDIDVITFLFFRQGACGASSDRGDLSPVYLHYLDKITKFGQ